MRQRTTPPGHRRVLLVGCGFSLAAAVVLGGCQRGDESVVVGRLAQISPNADVRPTDPAPSTIQRSVAPSTTPTADSSQLTTVATSSVAATVALAPSSVASTTTTTSVAVPATPAVVPSQPPSGFDAPAGSPTPTFPDNVANPRPTVSGSIPAARTTVPWAVPTNPPNATPSIAPVNSQSGTTATVQGVTVPIIEGWTAFTTSDEVLAASSLNTVVASTLATQLREDPTRAFLVATDEFSSATPSVISIVVRSGSGLTGEAAVERLVTSSVSTEKFVVESRQSNSWQGLAAAQASLTNGNGTHRYIAAASTPNGRLTVIQSTGARADLAAVHSRLVAEVNPAQG